MIYLPLSVHQEVTIPLSQGGGVSAEWPEKNGHLETDLLSGNHQMVVDAILRTSVSIS